MDVLGAVALCVLALLGAGLQRISGMGFALTVAPVAVVVAGPAGGIAVVNACSALLAAVLTVHLWRGIDRRRATVLICSGVVGVGVGALITRAVPGAWLEVVIGLLVIVSVVLVSRPRVRMMRARAGGTAGAGVASGIMSMTAGISGPALALHAVATGWEPHRFAATVQPVFLALGTTSFAAKVLVPAGALEDSVNWALLAAVAASALCGATLAAAMARVIRAAVARRILLAVSTAGGVLVLVRGALALLA
ncbi:TSUP family transporter [Microbacterium lushaniae]|uniref:Probable membrane transporter protein n=1 Tax=Microbacterium lushaniae TaxID=2614639 RepID=A0A5J6L0G1_9MICO|nr:TSUP family transporter [Microbacterium lushaniae]QEW01961.1 TSUP family transporter [Microbacterium lushaniae]